MSSQCRVCLSDNTDVFMALGDQPNTMHLLKKGQESRLLDLTLSVCKDCGFVFIDSPGEREDFYDYVQLPTSMFPAEHIGEEIEEITSRHLDSPSDMILEIACNDGYFLNALREAGFANSLGIEPSVPASQAATKLGFNVKTTYFSKEEAENFVKEHGQPKLVISRHVLEHIDDLDSFTEGLSILMGEDTTLFLEVPDFKPVEERADFSSIWEQHVNYFDIETLRILFARFGIEVFDHRTVPFSGGSLITSSRKSEKVKAGKKVSADKIEARLAASERMQAHMSKAKTLLKRLKDQGKRIAGFGAGARCSGFINFADLYRYLDYIVDEDPRKFGLYMPKSHLEICPTSRLKDDPVDYCIILPFNSKINEAKVMEKNRDFVEAGGTFIETWVKKEDGSISPIEIR